MSNHQTQMDKSTASTLPSEWSWGRIGDFVVKFIGGCSPTKRDYTKSGFLVLNKGNIKSHGQINFGSERKFVSHQYANSFKDRSISHSDLVVTLRDLSQKADFLGLIGMYREVEPALLTQGANLIHLHPSLDKRFLIYYSNSPLYRTLAKKSKHGSTQVHLRNGDFLGFPIPIPPLPEQHLIVAEIEKQFTRLDAGVAALRRAQANLKRYRAAVLKAACEGRLVPTEAEIASAEGRPFESGQQLHARILNERRQLHERAQSTASRKKKYKEPSAPSIPPDKALPPGWTWATWDQIGISQNGRPFPSAQYQETGFKLLRPGNLNVSGKVIWTEGNTRCMPQDFADENPDLIVGANELVMNLTAQSLKDEFLGRVCITAEGEACLLNQRLARLTPIIVLPEFALYLLKAWRFRRFVDGLNSGSLIQHMFTSQLAGFTFPLPPLAEQTRILAEVERRLSVVEELEAMVTANLQRAIRLRQSILQKAFTGELL